MSVHKSHRVLAVTASIDVGMISERLYVENAGCFFRPSENDEVACHCVTCVQKRLGRQAKELSRVISSDIE